MGNNEDEKGFVVYGEGGEEIPATEQQSVNQRVETKVGTERESTRESFMLFSEEDEGEVSLFEEETFLKEYRTPIVLVSFIIVLVLVRMFFFTLSISTGQSMSPTLNNYELLLLDKITSVEDYETGDIIVFKQDGKSYVKRIIAKSGDTIKIEGNLVIVNGEVLDEDHYLDTDLYPIMLDMAELKVPEKEFFVMGDNRANSLDSRNGLGAIEYSSIKGVVKFNATLPIDFD